tara:strand:+ start:202 stop:1314 length:1113 start_codon:yes stop_codon:yes gene_type:complete
MPIYKGTVEVTSGNLHKGSTEIENGYKGADPFYLNETTVSFATPTGQGFTYSIPSPQSSTGSPGLSFPSTTFTINGGSQAISGTASVAGLPTGLSITGQSYSGSGPGNTLTVTIGGTFPTTSSLNTALTISGLTTVTYYTISLNWNGLTATTSGSGTINRSGSISGTGAINVTNTGGVWSGQFPSGTSITAFASYSVSQSGAGGDATNFRQKYLTGGYSGGVFGISSPFTMAGGAPSSNTTGFSKSSNSITVTGNASYVINGGYSVLSSSTWGFGIGTPPATAPSLTAIVVGGVSSFNAYNVIARSATFNGGALVYMNPPGGGFNNGGVGGTIPAGTNITQLQIQKTSPGSASFSINWGGGVLSWTTVFT